MPLGQDNTAAGVEFISVVVVDGIAIVRRGAEAANWLLAAVVLTARVTGCRGSVAVGTGVVASVGAALTDTGWMGNAIGAPSSSGWSWTGGDSDETVDDEEPSVALGAALAGIGSSPSCVAMMMHDRLTHAFFSRPGPPYLFWSMQFLHTLQSWVLSRFRQPRQVPQRERFRLFPVTGSIIPGSTPDRADLGFRRFVFNFFRVLATASLTPTA